MKILTIHDGHNASVTLFENGKNLVSIQEERFTYEKNQGGLPINSLKYITDNYEIKGNDIIAFSSYHIPTHDWSKSKVLKLYSNSDSYLSIIKQYLKKSNLIYRIYSNQTIKNRKKKFLKYFPNHSPKFIDHHLGHAATAYFGLGNYSEPILVITADGDGDGKSGGIFIGDKGELREMEYLSTKHSLGRVYSYITYLFNMVPFEHEYKIMGLAAYCKDRERIEKCKMDFYNLMNFRNNDEIFWKYIGNYPSVQSAGKEYKKIFYRYRFDVLAAALQAYAEELICEMIRRAVKKYNIDTIALAGGIFMNVKANMLIAKIDGIKKVFVFPSCGDETLPIGVANYIYFKVSGEFPEPLSNFYLGDSFVIDEPGLIDLQSQGIKVNKFDDIEKEVAKIVANGGIVGRVKGKMEFGARALGNRSILANPSIDDVLKTINDMIKNRDFWMPFAPSVLAEDLEEYFYIDRTVADYEYMIFTCESRPEKKQYAKNALHPYDYSGRPQAVREEQNPDYYRLLKYYKKFTGESLILNTSYNLHGYPIVRTQEQVLHVFLESGLNYLAIDNFLLEKQ